MLRLMAPTPSTHAAREPDWADLRQRLNRYAAALTGGADEADELTQQTFASLLAKAPRSADHLGYARTTMTRLWLDRQRSLKRRVRVLRSIAATWLDRRPDADRLDVSEQAARAQRAIETLPPRQRAALVMRLIEGLDYATIAASLGCDAGAVRSSLHLARASLRETLGENP